MPAIRDGVVRFPDYKYSTTISATPAQVLPRGVWSILERHRIHMMEHAERLIPNGSSIFPIFTPTRITFPNLET
jgi:hypothetical protein